MDDCIFCNIIKGVIPNFRIYEDDMVLAFADINPVSKGHTLVIPKLHAENLWEIPENYLTAVHLAARKIVHAMKEALCSPGVICLQLNGKSVNQVVMHYHLHLIPRSSDEPPLKMTTWELRAGNMEEIKSVSEKIASAIK